jgi:hypothetical protein
MLSQLAIEIGERDRFQLMFALPPYYMAIL